MLSLLALAPLPPSGAASAQQVPSPRNNVDAAVIGMGSLCPALVGGATAPDATAAARFGFRPMEPDRDSLRFRGVFDDGLLQLRFDPADRRCTIHFGGPRFREVAGAGREIATRNGFTPLPGEVRDGLQRESFVRTRTGSARRESYIIIQNLAAQRAAVSYAERTDS